MSISYELYHPIIEQVRDVERLAATGHYTSHSATLEVEESNNCVITEIKKLPCGGFSYMITFIAEIVHMRRQWLRIVYGCLTQLGLKDPVDLFFHYKVLNESAEYIRLYYSVDPIPPLPEKKHTLKSVRIFV